MALLVFGSGLAGCGLTDDTETMTVLAGSELRDIEPLLDDLAERSGVRLELTYTGTLTGAERIVAGEDFDLAWFSHSKYLDLLAAGSGRIQASTPIMLSPVTMGVRRPVAQQLGWSEGSDVAWADIAAASAAGDLDFAMTNPASSNSGFTALVAVATGLADTGGAITASDVDQLDLTGFFAGQQLTAGSSGWLADSFASPDGADLDAMVNYESVLLNQDDLVLVYPTEGVVTADYPLVLLDGDRKEAYDRLTTALLDPEFQADLGRTTLRRPAVPGVPVDDRIPDVRTSEVPFPATLDAIDALLFSYLDEARAPAHTFYLLDVSGSMSGAPLAELQGAMANLTGLDQSVTGRFARFRRRERITIIPFSTGVESATTYEVNDVSPGSADLAAIRTSVDALLAGGDTAIYDALDLAFTQATAARREEPDRYYSIVLLTDGQATAGLTYDQWVRTDAVKSNRDDPIRTFPILFGNADAEAMAAVAEATSGRVFDAEGDLNSVFKTIRGYQ